jgi:hypothetical protein
VGAGPAASRPGPQCGRVARIGRTPGCRPRRPPSGATRAGLVSRSRCAGRLRRAARGTRSTGSSCRGPARSARTRGPSLQEPCDVSAEAGFARLVSHVMPQRRRSSRDRCPKGPLMTLPHPVPPVQHQRTWRCTALRLAGAIAVAPSAPHEPCTWRGR